MRPSLNRRTATVATLLVAASLVLAACGTGKTATTHTTKAIGSIASVPVRTVHTRLGTVGYAGTMEVWDPRFVDDLAEHFRVTIFDNAGVGHTQALPAPLTIDAMADQTSAVISALGLGRPNVLGWSMGSMIAEALAVLHPSQVRRLVLCAAFPSTGTVARPSQSEIDALTSGNPQKTAAALFPSDRGVAYSAYVADGIVDRIDPLSNSRTLLRLISGARLVLFPDAGHAFLFQDPTTVAFAIKSFLTGAPKPVSTSVIRKEFLAGQARVTAAGKTWFAQLKALHHGDTSTQVAEIDKQFANTLTQLDEQLLSSGTGRLGAAVTTFVDAYENLADDILATSATTPSTSAALKAAFAKDGAAVKTATSTLRHALGLPPAHTTQ